jgi:hypothetical protein
MQNVNLLSSLFNAQWTFKAQLSIFKYEIAILVYQPTNAQTVTSIKLLQVSTPGRHPQGVDYSKRIQVQHAKLGIASLSLG